MSAPARPLRRERDRLIAGALMAVLIGGLHLAILSYAFPAGAPPSPPPPPVPAADAVVREPAPPPPAPAAAGTIEGTIRKGQGFAAALQGAGVSPEVIPGLVQGIGDRLDFRRCRPGDRFSLTLAGDGAPLRFTYQTGPLELLEAERAGGAWTARTVRLPVSLQVEEVRGVIDTSLYEAIRRAGEGEGLGRDFVDIFAWDIDFSHELQRGDTFRVVVEKLYRDGVFIDYGRLLAAEYRDRREPHLATHFPWPDGGGDYYAPDGQSLRKSFLRSPVSYTRISSGYSARRLHPVDHHRRPHRAIDYAAPAGTPVWAAADGTVASVSRDRSNGRMVVIRHPNGYRTYYLHLSRFARGLRTGSSVRQKDVIGYVGSSGVATGPHLDYRMRRGSTWCNPLEERFPPGRKLPAARMEEFSAYRRWLAGETYSALPGEDGSPGQAGLPPPVVYNGG